MVPQATEILKGFIKQKNIYSKRRKYMKKKWTKEEIGDWFDRNDVTFFKSIIAGLPEYILKIPKIPAMIEESGPKYMDAILKPDPYNLFAFLLTAPYGNWLQNIMNKYNIKATKEYFEYYISGKEGAPDYMEILVLKTYLGHKKKDPTKKECIYK